MGDWLGTGTIAPSLKEYRSFREARAFVHKLKLKDIGEWRAFTKGRLPRLGKLPSDIPANPNQTYANEGWKSVGDWLGTGSTATFLRNYRPFAEARAFARKLKLNGGTQWALFCKGEMPQVRRLPTDIPAAPYRVYAGKGWIDWGNWLGTGNVAHYLKQYRSFQKARSFAQKLKLKSQTEWTAFCKGEMPHIGRLPADIPAKPRQTYADKGWKDMGDWLGTGTISPSLREYRSFRDARAFVRRLGLKNVAEWVAYSRGEMPRLGRLSADISASPDRTYAAKGWKNWGDWLGTGAVAPRFREYLSFREARALARKLNLKSGAQWTFFCKGKMPQVGRLPADIPAGPSRIYSDKGWKGMGDWLGTGSVANRLRKFRPFREARAFARKLKLKREHDWRDFCKGEMQTLGRLPEDIPANPNESYANKGWKGMGNWLGTGNVSNRLKRFRSFRKARAFARRLKLNSSTEWLAFCKGEMSDKGRLPKDMPKAPSQVYANKGWAGFSHWLGNRKGKQ